jgi:hypothetical protein
MRLQSRLLVMVLARGCCRFVCDTGMFCVLLLGIDLFVTQACFVCCCSESEFFSHDFVDVLVPQARRFGVTLECLVDF